MLDKLFIPYTFPKLDFEVQHGDKILLIGSCFSDEIGNHFSNAGHDCLVNPFGTIFHPTALANNILACFDNVYQENILERDGSFYSWDCSTKVTAKSFEEIESLLFDTRLKVAEFLSEAKVLFVTLGTAWGYELLQTEQLVANCHKAPADYFQKILSSTYEMIQDWTICVEKLKEINPDLKIVFTVSPVRHIKDGLTENMHSKSRLIEVSQQLSVEDNVSYFASYEYMIDVLRDYRFYKPDGVHPSEQAVSLIWENLQRSLMNADTIQLNETVEKFNRLKTHRLQDESIESYNRFSEKLTQKKMELLTRNSKLKI